MTDPLIRFDAVGKTFPPDIRVLEGLDLAITAGEHVCLIGPSGSGKSTILRLLMTLEQPTAGRVLIAGEELWPAIDGRPLSRAQKRQQTRLALRIGMVFQHFHLFPHLRVVENITLAPRLVQHQARDAARRRALELLDQVGLGDKADSYPADLSGGQKQRVAIARALAMEPDIMLFDEATSALDPELIGEVLAVIKELADTTDMTMLFVTHQMHFANDIGARVLMLDGGRIIEDGPPEQVLSNPEHPRTQEFLKAIDI